MEVSKRQNIIFQASDSEDSKRKQSFLCQWFAWHFSDVAKEILKGWGNFLKFNLNYFSIPLLFKTLFSYWRRYRWSYGRGFNIARYLEAFFSNLISRILGAIIRSFLIIIGLIVEIFLFLTGLIIFLAWLLLPFLLIGGIFYGFKLLI